jgi:hypothetical protein
MSDVKTKYFKFSQNNSGGHFEIDDERGIGVEVLVEAVDLGHSISRASDIGLYFDGVAAGIDCQCCGDRWSHPWNDDGEDAPTADNKYNFRWHPTVYVHRINGKIERLTKSSLS